MSNSGRCLFVAGAHWWGADCSPRFTARNACMLFQSVYVYVTNRSSGPSFAAIEMGNRVECRTVAIVFFNMVKGPAADATDAPQP